MSEQLNVSARSAGQLIFVVTAILLAEPAFSSCSISSSGLNFGNYDVFDSSHTDSTGTIAVDCDTATSYTLLLGPGHGTIQNRYLANGASTLEYNLYTDSSRVSVWGDRTSGSVIQSSSPSEHTVYGRIPARQNVKIGGYSDTVIITLEY